MDRKQIINLIQEHFQNGLGDSYKEGTLCYDLTVPYAYGVEKVTNFLEDVDQNLNPLTANEDILLNWAKPRIGDIRKEEPAKLIIFSISSTTIDRYSTWYLEESNYKFHIDDEGILSNVKLRIVGDSYYSFNKVVGVGSIFRASENGSIRAVVQNVITIGKEKESLEQYRQRYLQSVIIGKEYGLGTTYSSLISEYPGVGVAGVHYEESFLGTVHVYISSADYISPPSNEFCNEVFSYFTSTEHNIVPISQKLAILPMGSRSIIVHVRFKTKSFEEIQEKMESFFLNLTKDLYSIRLCSSKTLETNVDYYELYNLFVIQFNYYDIVTEFTLDGNQEDIVLTKKIPLWRFS